MHGKQIMNFSSLCLYTYFVIVSFYKLGSAVHEGSVALWIRRGLKKRVRFSAE